MIKCSSFFMFLTIALWPSASMGQEKFNAPITCFASTYLENRLRGAFDESPIGAGSLKGRIAFELWISENGESWSFLFRPRKDVLCHVASGAEWHEVVDGIPIRGRGD